VACPVRAGRVQGRAGTRHRPVPFHGADAIETATCEHLARIASTCSAFDFALTGLGEFPDCLWLRPEPDEPFRRLTNSLHLAFPDYPPYGGVFPDTRPHLTVGHAAPGAELRELRAQLESALSPALPLICHASDLALYISDSAGVWRPERRFALGG
jgi:2'-5' RNA ligase